MDRMHQYGDDTEALSRAIVAYARNRIASPQPLDRSATGEDLTRRAGITVTPDGLGGDEALRIWSEVLAPATISTDHPSSMAFVPGAPTKASVLFDLVVGASLDDRGGLDRRRGRDLGREPGPAMGRRPGELSTRSRRGVRLRGLGGQPVGAGGRSARPPTIDWVAGPRADGRWRWPRARTPRS